MREKDAQAIIDMEARNELSANGIRNLLFYKLVKELKETNRLLMCIGSTLREKRDI